MSKHTQRGFSLIEVLISLVVIAVGLLGMAALQLRAQHAELEALQRSQALILVEDMVNRIEANRRSSTALCYAITDAVAGAPFAGIDSNSSDLTCSAYGTNATRATAEADLTQWDAMLQGAGEMLGGTAVGAMTGARGCIFLVDPATDLYRVSVAWQGDTDTAVPSDPCATDLYGQETKRRVVSRTFRLPTLN